ncbi:MAG: FAD-binding oxidoreductase [Acidobacteriaceae bacterium]|jgi:FAD/FMN-containing dehydrogenase
MSPKQDQPQFESWGRYPKYFAEVRPLFWRDDFPASIAPDTKMLAVGMGRSYGDVCLLQHGTLLQTPNIDRLISFDSQSGVLRCEAGVTLAQILDFAVPRGWFLPVSPGTKYVTVGGAIANDIHGKNHHVAGTFGLHTPRFELVRSDGTQLMCSATENPEWYAATIGGLGLTGLISWAEVRLRPIVSRRIRYRSTQFVGLEEFVALSQAATHDEYSVAWIDCVAQGRNFARGVFIQGEHDETPGPLTPLAKPNFALPFDLPELALNRATVGAFNTLYYHKQMRKQRSGLTDYEPFFYPLDRILKWNRLYGRQGLLQFQCVLPWESGTRGIYQQLKAITESGLGSFLAVIKVFGDAVSPGIMSFPAPGITLALDFPIRREVSFGLLDRLANITAEFGGRMYPAKDACMSAAHFQQFYPQWPQWAAYIDPSFSSSFWQRVSGLG